MQWEKMQRCRDAAGKKAFAFCLCLFTLLPAKQSDAVTHPQITLTNQSSLGEDLSPSSRPTQNVIRNVTQTVT